MTSAAAGPPGLIDPRLVSLTPIEDAVVVNVAANGLHPPVVAWITHDEVAIAQLDVETGDVLDATAVNDSIVPIAHPIERPAVSVRDDGTVDLAFTSAIASGGSVFYTIDGAEPALISGDPRRETNLVHITEGTGGPPILAWLEDSTLSVTSDTEDGPHETEWVDDLTCDCCNPMPVRVDDGLVVAYRDYEIIDDQIVRNVAAVRSAESGAFEATVPIADDDWYLTGCPFSGPTAVATADALVVAWMDARQSVHPEQSSSSIWVDRSEDGGRTFGTDLAVVGEGLNRWPVMTIDEHGLIHLVWETQGPDGGLSYARSEDGGRTFGAPTHLIGADSYEGGAPKTPSIVAIPEGLVVTWADSERGYVAVFQFRD